MLRKAKEITSQRLVSKVVLCDMFKMQNQPKFLSYVSPRLQELFEKVLDMTDTASYEVLCTTFNRSVTHSRLLSHVTRTLYLYEVKA